MNTKKLIFIIVLLAIISPVALGNRVLNRTEILRIFQTLTAQPRNTWISAGTIEATHLAYNQSTGYITDSYVIVKYDGDRFYWETNINSHTSEAKAKEPSPRDSFNLNWNKRRIFVWDGQRYTMYFKSGNNAIVNENPSNIPVRVNGSLTAGIIPWGYGIYTLEELSIAESSAEVDDQGQIHLTLNSMNIPEIVFILDDDPAKNYPVLSCSINDPDHSSIVKTYGDYELVSDRWVPTTILIERYDNSKQTAELLTYDYWEVNSISGILPPPDSFDVGYETGALVEHYLPTINEPLSYRHLDEVDTDSLLQDRTVTASASDTQIQNCATITMKYVSKQLDKNVTDLRLTELITEPNESTNLYKMRQFAQELGFHCRAVKTDITTLKNLNTCQVILHLPGPNHFVVLEHVDDEYAWVIDLDHNKFFYRTRLDQFDIDWGEGTALLISNEPLNNLEGNFTELDDNRLRKIIGKGPKYSCTNLTQTYDIILCSEMMGGLCGSSYTIFTNRYSCQEDPNGGDCFGKDLVGNITSICIEDPYNPGACDITGNWYSQYIRACK